MVKSPSIAKPPALPLRLAIVARPEIDNCRSGRAKSSSASATIWTDNGGIGGLQRHAAGRAQSAACALELHFLKIGAVIGNRNPHNPVFQRDALVDPCD